MVRNSTSIMFAAVFVISSVFGVSLGKTLGAPRAYASSTALNGRPGAHLLEDEFPLLEDEFDEPVTSLSEALRVDEGVGASSSLSQLAALSALGTPEARYERASRKSYALSVLLKLMTFYLVLSGCYRFFVERFAVTSTASANDECDMKEDITPADFSKMAKVISEDRADQLEAMLASSRQFAQARDSYGCTALHLAAHSGATACLRLLVAQGAVDVDAKDAWEETPLHFAARRGSVAACELLLFHGAALNALNSGDEAPLMSAGKAGRPEVCDFLLARGAIVGDCDDAAIPPVLSAAMFCRLVNSQELLE